MFNNNGGYSLADLAAVTNGGNNGWGGFGGDGAWLIILFLLFAFNGWGGMGFGGFGGMGGFGAGMLGSEFMMWPWMMTQNTDNIVQNGFNTQALGTQLSGIQSSITSGFGDTALGIAGINQNICSTGNGITSAIANGFSAAEVANNARQMANMQQAFNAQTAVTAGMNTIAGDLQQCCCENRSNIADLKYTVATEACADRAAVEGALRDVTAQGVANTTALMNTITGGIQAIKDQLCQDKIDAKNERIVELQNQITMKDLAASQAAQTAQLIADNTAQTQYLVNRVAPYPTAAYLVGAPNVPYGYPYYGFNSGCGCGNYNNLVA